jgi:hypothetical protein
MCRPYHDWYRLYGESSMSSTAWSSWCLSQCGQHAEGHVVQQTDTSHEYTGKFSPNGGMKILKGSIAVLHTVTDIRDPNSSISGATTLIKSQYDLPHRLLRPELLILRMKWMFPLLFSFTINSKFNSISSIHCKTALCSVW